jgi:hypothetical protein
MMNEEYLTEYTNSWALVIGINEYHNVLPLEYACNDAEAVAQALIDGFDFPESNVTLLTNEEASRDNLREAFLDFAQGKVEPDDRVLVFFAGHGHTQLGPRREAGFLVPVDGTPDKLSSLIRWDELVRNGDLIPAKHIFFVMDACYGGIVITRALPPGSTRFLKDMLRRFSRQVLTAGKADEVVADSGGPLLDHSVFTGHFLQALEGGAATPDGIITANGIMSYVYEKVSREQDSQQTPHYGFVAGDGDFIFQMAPLSGLTEKSEVGQDILVEIPSTIGVGTTPVNSDLADTVKEYISDARHRIELDDLVTKEIRRVASLTTDDSFPVEGVAVTAEEFTDRLKRYENIVYDLQAITLLLARWGAQEHTSVLRKIVTRTTDYMGSENGMVVWLGLRWYPAAVLMYSGGIGAIAAENYDNLATILTTRTHPEHLSDGEQEAILPVVRKLLTLDRARVFEKLPGYERLYVPRSEYLFKALQPHLDDLLFLGRSYETLFDRFEVFLALIHADLDRRDTGDVWGPPGRFAWKHNSPRRDGPSVFTQILEEGETQKDDWPPLRAGLFGGSYQRFAEVAMEYGNMISRLHWF